MFLSENRWKSALWECSFLRQMGDFKYRTVLFLEGGEIYPATHILLVLSYQGQILHCKELLMFFLAQPTMHRSQLSVLDQS